jgi:hypothetical protein
MGDEYPLLYAPENVEHLRIVLQDGHPVAHVGLCVRDAVVAGCRLTIGSIGSVGTHPDVRAQGFASLALNDTIALLEAMHADIMLVSGDRGLYRRAACVDCGRTFVYTIPAGTHLPMPGGLRAVTAGANHLDGLIRVHQREVARFVRSRDDWERMLQAHPLAREAAERRQFFLAEDGGGAVAYVVGRTVRHLADGRFMAQVVEYAGDAGAVAGLLTTWTARPDVVALRITVPEHDAPLNLALRRAVAEPPQPSIVPTTIRLVDPVALLQHLHVYLTERLGTAQAAALRLSGGAGGSFTIHLGDHTATAPDRAALTWLLLGTHHPDRLAWLDGAPVALRAALDAAFPVPLPLPGLNYV